MSILFRYLLHEFSKMFLMCFAVLVTIYVVVDFFEKLRRFLRYDAELTAIGEYLLLMVPNISFQMAPLAVLGATILTLGVLTRSHEITAMRSCGISLGRITAPFLVFAITVAATLLYLSTVLIPVTTIKADYIQKLRIEKKPAVAATFRAEHPWVRVSQDRLMSIETVDPDGATFHGIRLYTLGANFHLTEVVEAKTLRHQGGVWVLSEGTERALGEDGKVSTTDFEMKPIVMNQKPEDFQRWLSRSADVMTSADLHNYIRRLEKDGHNTARPLTDYHDRLANPFVCIVMVLVGVALSQLGTGTRGRGMARGIGLALIIGLAYWITHSVAIALGRTGELPAVMAGWSANLVFLSFGLYLLLTVRH